MSASEPSTAFEGLRWRVVALVAAGGAGGTWVRWTIDQWVAPSPVRWPWGTTAVNLVGSALLGMFVGRAARQPQSWYLRPLLGSGFLGGLTTMSAVMAQSWAMMRAEKYLWAVTYVMVSVVAGVAMFAWGYGLVARRSPRGAGVVADHPVDAP